MFQPPVVGELWRERYRITEQIGSGGFGVVYLATDRDRRDVAIKVERPRSEGESLADEATRRLRFSQEIDIAARLDHPNIVTIHDWGDGEDGPRFLVMRHVRGHTLADELAAGPLDVARTHAVVAAVSGALHHAHERGVLHRDVKPANVLCEAGSQRVFLTDFGIAKYVERQTDERLTALNALPMTVAYAAPEQFLPGASLDRRADVYALGCVLFACLTGRPPFGGDAPLQVGYAHANLDPPSVADLRSGLVDEWDRLFAQVLAKRPDDRFATCAAFEVALDHTVERQLAAVPSLDRTSRMRRLPPPPRAPDGSTGRAASDVGPSRGGPRPPPPTPPPTTAPPATAPPTTAPPPPTATMSSLDAADHEAVVRDPAGTAPTVAATGLATEGVTSDDAFGPPAVDRMRGGRRRPRLRRVLAGLGVLGLVLAGSVAALIGFRDGGVGEAESDALDEAPIDERADELGDGERELAVRVGLDAARCQPSAPSFGAALQLACEVDATGVGQVIARRYDAATGPVGALDTLIGNDPVADDADCRGVDRARHAWQGTQGAGEVVCSSDQEVSGVSWTFGDDVMVTAIGGPDARDDLVRWWDGFVGRTPDDHLPDGCDRDGGLEAEDAVIAAVACALDDGAARTASWAQFRTASGMDRWFDRTVASRPDGLAVTSDLADCATATPDEGREAGALVVPESTRSRWRLLCFVNSSGLSVLFWTDELRAVGGIATAPVGAASLGELMAQWRDEPGSLRP